MTRFGTIVTIALGAFVLNACSSTKLETAWQAPAASPVAFTKVLALAITSDKAQRRVTETEICRQVQTATCVPAYTIIPETETLDVEKAKARVKAAGFDGAIVFRVVSAREKVTYVPPSYGPSFWGYYGHALPTTYAPGYEHTDTLVRVETSVYSVSADQLIWVGTTETMNPSSVPDLVGEVAAEVAADMRKRGLLAAK